MSNNRVQIVEVGLRDGLQNEAAVLKASEKAKLAIALLEAGVSRLELGAFVRGDRIPQMADSLRVIQMVLKKFPNQKRFPFSALVPNEIGMQQALKSGIKEISLFTASSDLFTQANINCSVEESLKRFEPVLQLAKLNKVRVRGYLSTAFACPYEGFQNPRKVAKVAKKLLAAGCFEVSIGDTIGVADPRSVEILFKELFKLAPASYWAAHFHDTRGTALANCLRAFDLGVRTFDSSLGGLGGCPYAQGASGNVATEDLLYMFSRMNVNTGIDLSKYLKLSQKFFKLSQFNSRSKTLAAGGPLEII